MKLLLVSALLLACAAPAFADEDSAMSAGEKAQLIKKLSKFKGKVNSGNGTTVRSAASYALKNLDKVDLKCEQLNPLLDDNSRKQILDCTARFPNPKKEGLVELNFGTVGWEASIAKITDAGYRACGRGEIGMVEGHEGEVGGQFCKDPAPHPVGLPVERPHPVGMPVQHEEEPVRVGMPVQHDEEPVRVGMPAPRKDKPQRVGMPVRHEEEPQRVGMPVQHDDEESHSAGAQ